MLDSLDRNVGRRPFMMVVFLIMACFMTGVAHGQFGQVSGIGDIMNPYYYRRDLQIITDGLELDEDQQVFLEVLFFDYEESHARNRKNMLAQITSLKDQMESTNRTQLAQMIFDPFLDQSRRWNEDRDMFLQNLHLMLNEVQRSRWGEFLKQLRREKEIERGQFSGERIDLDLEIQKLNLDREQQDLIAMTMREYLDILDELLIARELASFHCMSTTMNAMITDNYSAAIPMIEQLTRTQVAVRDHNLSFNDRIAAELSGTSGPVLHNAILTAGFPRVFRQTRAQRVFRDAKKLDLEEGQLEAIIALETEFLALLHDLNMRIVHLIIDFEPKDMNYRVKKYGLRNSDPPKPEDASRAAFAERETLGREYVTRLRAILTPDQFLEIPDARSFIPREAGAEVAGSANPKNKLGNEMKRRKRDEKGGGNQFGQKQD